MPETRETGIRRKVMASTTWKQRLADRIPPAMGQEIDTFENMITLRKAGKIEDKVFAETRLRRVSGELVQGGQ